VADPRLVRLETDAEGLRRLARESGGAIAIEAAEGVPPRRYVLTIRCPGVAELVGDKPRIASEHQVEVALGVRYPLEPPVARFLTPIFHPHVFTDGRVCLGHRTGLAERLEDLVVRLGRLIQYDPEMIDENSPANRAALAFLKSRGTALPFGRVTFRAAGAKRPAGPVRWSDRS